MHDSQEPLAAAHALTRRQMIAGVVMACGALGWGSTGVRAQAAGEISHSAESIHQEPVIKASRKRVYDALTDARRFNEVVKIVAATESAISLEKAPTAISPDVGGAFLLFGGIILGRHVELVPDTRIVQAWRVALLGSGDLLNRPIRARYAGHWNPDRLRPYGLPQGRCGIPGVGMEGALLGAARKISGSVRSVIAIDRLRRRRHPDRRETLRPCSGWGTLPLSLLGESPGA